MLELCQIEAGKELPFQPPRRGQLFMVPNGIRPQMVRTRVEVSSSQFAAFALLAYLYIHRPNYVTAVILSPGRLDIPVSYRQI